MSMTRQREDVFTAFIGICIGAFACTVFALSGEIFLYQKWNKYIDALEKEAAQAKQDLAQANEAYDAMLAQMEAACGLSKAVADKAKQDLARAQRDMRNSEATAAHAKQQAAQAKQEAACAARELQQIMTDAAGSEEMMAWKAPNDFICPIMHVMMVHPMICADGHSYEHAAISKWLSSHATSPYTGLLLEHTNLIPNHTLRGSIDQFRKQQQ